MSVFVFSGWEAHSKDGLTLLERFLDPDPLLLASEPGHEGNVMNPKFHALNRAIIQLVRIASGLQRRLFNYYRSKTTL